MSVKFLKKIDSSKDFISLGKIDKEEFMSLCENYSKIALDNPIFKVALDSITKWQQKKSKKISTGSDIVKAYAKGLDVTEDEVYSSLLVPEIIASFNKWLPNLLGLIPGCSSLFTLNSSKDSVIHTRLLDYTAGLELTSTERALRISNNKENDIFGFSFAGHPIISTSAINEKGLSLAIHYKHGNFFNIEGSSIFEICYDLLLKCDNIEDVKKRIKKHTSIAHWGIYICDKDNKVASLDIRGNEINFESFDIKDYDYLYFNNKKMNTDNKKNHFQPFGHELQCRMRRNTLIKSFKKYNPTTKADALKCILEINTENTSWELSPLTISTVQAYSFEIKNKSALFIKGNAPKYISREHIGSKNVFEENFFSLKEEEVLSTFEQAHEQLSKAQSMIDLKDYQTAYFHIQMANAGFKGTHEEYISFFYFNVLEYITTSNKKDLYFILGNFKSLSNKLPSYLNDHCLLFIFRIYKILEESYQLEDFRSKIKTKNLQLLLEKEHKLNPFSIKMLKKLIYPKIEICDIIYAY